MPASQTKLDVFNLAIDIIRDTALLDPDQDAPTARWLNRNWRHTVSTTLRAYPWNFAKQLVSLPADATPVATPKWLYSYKPPAGWVRVLTINRAGARFGLPVPYEIIGDRICTDEAAPIYPMLLMDKTANPGVWDPLFTEMVRCKLALGMANKFTSKAKYVELASQMLTKATEQAELIDAFEGTPEPTEQFDILRARGDTYDGRGWR